MKKQRWRFTKQSMTYVQCEDCDGYGLNGQFIGNMHISFSCKKCDGEGFYENK